MTVLTVNPAQSASPVAPQAVLAILQDCPLRSSQARWPAKGDVRRAAIAGTDLYLVRCAASATEDFTALVTLTGGKATRQGFPQFVGGKIVKDDHDRTMGALTWQTKSQRLTGRFSAGCSGAIGTSFAYRWTGEALALVEQRSSGDCLTPVWKTEFREAHR
ncbi:hypothetical protein BH11PSE2_BH11PSE2_18270 [soil metagenome]